jgi:hypothetical protein
MRKRGLLFAFQNARGQITIPSGFLGMQRDTYEVRIGDTLTAGKNDYFEVWESNRENYFLTILTHKPFNLLNCYKDNKSNKLNLTSKQLNELLKTSLLDLFSIWQKPIIYRVIGDCIAAHSGLMEYNKLKITGVYKTIDKEKLINRFYETAALPMFAHLIKESPIAWAARVMGGDS